MVTPIRIVLADDHGVVRAGLRMLLGEEPGFEVVAEASDVDGALRAVLGHKPDVLVLDLNMPGEQSSLEALPGVTERSPGTRTVILTMQEDPEYARRALRAGALGYVLKEAADAELIEAVHRAAAGGTYLNPALGARLATIPEQPAGLPDGLSEREVEVLRLIALGHTNAEIGEQLFLSWLSHKASRRGCGGNRCVKSGGSGCRRPSQSRNHACRLALSHRGSFVRQPLSVRTVETHRAHIQQKLARSTRSELVRYALDHGLLDGA